MKSSLLLSAAVVALAAAPPATEAVKNLKIDWPAFETPLKIPKVIDMREGGHLDMQIGQSTHNWTADGKLVADIYGYGLKNETPTFPGPTILVSSGKQIDITWYNMLGDRHILDDSVELTLTYGASDCYPYCGVPVVVHVHGLESPAKYDGLPRQSLYQNQSRHAVYLNTQAASTKMYHDHAMGLTRLNTWAGLMGAYIIQDAKVEAAFNVDIKPEWDIPLVLTDRLISNEGKLMYSDDSCVENPTSKWIPEAYGVTNLVNGVVMPYLEVPPAQVRLRFINAANARHYNLTIPFADRCTIIAKDSGFVQIPKKLQSPLLMFPFERVEVICDFTNEKDETEFEVTDVPNVETEHYDTRVVKVRVMDKLKPTAQEYRKLPETMSKFKDLRQLWKDLKGKQRALMLGEMEYFVGCPSKSLLLYRNQEVNVTNMGTVSCTRGKVERWAFRNPTDDPHPFHWHLVNAQCGPSDDEIDTNALKDVVVIPNAGDRPPETVTQVCYVACTPDQFLLQDSTRGPADYGFDTSEPYVAHCHILEHEENAMMSWFKILDADDDVPDDDGTVQGTSNKVTGAIIATAMGMSVLGGLATCASIFVISVERLKFLASPYSLAFAFALSAGVMIFIAFADLYTEAINFYRAAFTKGGGVDPEAYEKGGAAQANAGVCDKTCGGHAWLATTGVFFLGVAIIMLVEFIVHRCFERTGHRHSHGEMPPIALPNSPSRSEIAEKNIATPAVGSPHSSAVALSTAGGDSSELESQGNHKTEFKRAGIMTGVAVAIHNFPEGLALFVSSLAGLRTGIVLSIGIIMHNLPEGVAVAAPVYYATGSKWEAFKWTAVSGVAQPLGAAIGWAAVSGGMSFGLQASLYAVVAGMLMAITAQELIPGAFRFDPSGKVFVAALFIGVAIIASSLIFIHYAGSG